MYIANLVRERRCEDAIWIDTFEVDDSVPHAELAMRNAVKEFLATEEGKKAIEYTSHDFNWGDVVSFVPEKIWAKHGLRFQQVKSVDIFVNQDEVLCSDEGYKYHCLNCGAYSTNWDNDCCPEWAKYDSVED